MPINANRFLQFLGSRYERQMPPGKRPPFARWQARRKAFNMANVLTSHTTKFPRLFLFNHLLAISLLGSTPFARLA